MDEDFLDVTENNRGAFIIFLLIVVVLGVSGYFLVFKRYYFSVKTVTVELGEEISTDVKDYLKVTGANSSKYKLNVSNVNTNEVGEYTYTVTYNKTVKKGKVIVSDTTAPTFTLEEMTIEEGSEDYFLGDFISTCEDLSTPCLVTLKNDGDESKFSTVGTHSIEIVVSDLYGNKANATATLNVVKNGEYTDPRSLDLEYASNSLGIENFDGTVYEKLDKALNPKNEETEQKLAQVSVIDLESYVKANYDGYTLKSSEIIELYNKSSFVIGYSIRLTISNGQEKIVYVEKDKVPKTTSEEDTNSEE